jgi:hypothetical protein
VSLGRVRLRSRLWSSRVLRPADRLRPNIITGAIGRLAAGAIAGRVVGAGTIARRAAGGTATPRIAITGDRPTVIFSTRSLANATIVQRQPPITPRRRRRVN